MDYSCRDIPMRLDIKYQPLDFEIYLSQVIEIPKTCANDEPYNFQLELKALKHVDDIIARIQGDEEEKLARLNGNNASSSSEPQEIIPPSDTSDLNTNDSQSAAGTSKQIVNTFINSSPIIPTCPKETPLTPIKSSIYSGSNTDQTLKLDKEDKPSLPQINPREFEEIDYNPFDQIELQTIDELRELNLVFQASYANQNSIDQIQATTGINSNDNSSTPSISPPATTTTSQLSKNPT